eukprot:scaffold130848_cov18-Prasinocladus_malaysianus.AAC.1
MDDGINQSRACVRRIGRRNVVTSADQIWHLVSGRPLSAQTASRAQTPPGLLRPADRGRGGRPLSTQCGRRDVVTQ